MNKIVEIVIEAIATISNEKLSEIVKKYKLHKFIVTLEGKILEGYIKKYEHEKYYLLLDAFLEMSKFYEDVVRNVFSRVSKKSIEKQSTEVAMKFVEEYKEFSPFVQQIKRIVFELADSIYTSFLCSNILDGDNALYIRAQEQMNVVLEKISDISSFLIQMDNKINNFSFSLAKIEKKINEKEAYKELHKILCDETLTYFEKDIEYIKWIGEHGDLKEGLIYIADNCEKSDEINRAKRYYEYILKEYEEEYELYNNLGLIELKQRQRELAKQRFEKVLEYDENNVNALYNLAITYYTYEENCENALQYIKKAFEIEPLDADVVSFYAAILLEEEPYNCEYALTILSEALKINPKNLYLNINLGFAYLFQKKFAEGIILLEELNKNYPNQILCISLLAMIYAMKGVENAEKAIPLFEQAYNITKEEGYLKNILCLRQGLFFDSITYNYNQYEIYSDEELAQYYKSKNT